MPIAALVLGILGILFSLVPGLFIVGVPLGILALILGIVGRKSARSSGQPTGTATAGIVLGAIALVIGLAVLALCGALFGKMKDVGADFERLATELSKPPPPPEPRPALPADPKAPVALSAGRLHADVDDESFDAEKAYGGRPLQVTGLVTRVNRRMGEESIIGLRGDQPGEEHEVVCRLAPSAGGQASFGIIAKTITVTGTLSTNGDVALENCTVK